MAPLSCLLTYVLLAVAAVASPAAAGIPRGLMLIGDEQMGDEATGVTIARGHAELVVEKQPIHATADVIELHPKTNEILLKGRALLSVGQRKYQSDTVTCTLDFSQCASVETDQELPLTPGGTVAEIAPR